ncbi:hypothetical protein [Mitsuokella sp.]|nr:hypothetical protein [Mitsuokella sp.]
MKRVRKVKEADDKNLLSIVVWARDFFMGRIDKKFSNYPSQLSFL